MAEVRPKKRRSEEYKARRREVERRRTKTRVYIGESFQRWRELLRQKGFQSDAQVAKFLLDSYLGTRSESRPERPSLERTSSTETCDSMHCDYPFMSSPNEVGWESCAAPSIHSSENGKESGGRDGAYQRSNGRDEWMTAKLSENKENKDIKEDQDEEFATSLSVGDGCYVVDLGSPSEFIVDEECILQLFKSCRECNRQCRVQKCVKGLRLVVYQVCRFCPSRCKWTNLPDDDDDDGDDKDDSDFLMNGKDAAHGQTNTEVWPSSNTDSDREVRQGHGERLNHR